MIRLAKAFDLEDLDRIEQSAAELFIDTHMSWVTKSSIRAKDVYEQSIEQNLLWVSDVGEVVGFIAALRHRDCALIEELSVAKEHQRRGLGRALLDTAISRLADDGCRAVGLTTDHDLPWNRPFYERAGFTILSDEQKEPWLADRLRVDFNHGFDLTHRCAMLRYL